MQKPSQMLVSRLLSIARFSARKFSPLQTQRSCSPLPPPSSRPILRTQQFHHFTRRYSANGGGINPEFDQNKIVDEINLKFAEAREEIEMALESKETVYFNEEAECARMAVKEVLDQFDGLLSRLPDSEKAALQRSMGLKMEQLKAELDQLDD